MRKTKKYNSFLKLYDKLIITYLKRLIIDFYCALVRHKISTKKLYFNTYKHQYFENITEISRTRNAPLKKEIVHVEISYWLETWNT